MKYMTFNSSCAYAGVANMLERLGVETDDRTIALEMRLPYLFAYENGAYLAGPMLQSADWFNLYLHPRGFHMEETTLPSDRLADYLIQQETAMLGLQMGDHEKHAVVYMGYETGRFLFLNNQWENDPAPASVSFTEEELQARSGAASRVATLKKVQPEETDLAGRIRRSPDVIRRNLAEIRSLCGRAQTVAALRSELNRLFRPLLLDGITMLELLGGEELARQFSAVQSRLLGALRQNAETVVRLGDKLPVEQLETAAKTYIGLINHAE